LASAMTATFDVEDGNPYGFVRERPSQAPRVQFLHEQSMWPALVSLLQEFADDCDSAGVSSNMLTQRVRELRSEAGVVGSLDALEEGLRLAEEKGIGTFPQILRMTAFLARSASRIPVLFAGGLPFAIRGVTYQVCLTRRQCAALLAASFFGVLPDQQQTETWELDLPSFSLDCVLGEEVEKVLCLLSYFTQISNASEESLNEVVSFARRALEPLSDDFWQGLDCPLQNAFVVSGTIESEVANLQADFANKYLGGGALSSGNVQEEIRFAICPECFVGMLFCEVMLPNEAIFIVGTRQYSEYSGYGSSFRFAGPSSSESQAHAPDSWRRAGPHIVAFDALCFPGKMQYKEHLIRRELQKVYVACLGDLKDDASPPRKFASGNWGCGVFGGDPQLKSLIQWLACSAAGRELLYYPFDDHRVHELHRVFEKAAKLKCQDLYRILVSVGKDGPPVFAGVLQALE